MPGKTKHYNWGHVLIVNSISHSPRGYTDQELGSAWLENDFHPASAEQNKSGGYQLLILDGHNSHTTYKFCSFAEKHKIIVVCLPSHTTHRLQPCDVGVFGPLESCWKSIVNMNSSQYVAIRKNNLLQYYSIARDKAFSPSTIQAAFRKTGIWPLNLEAIEESAFAPALNTTTKPGLPLAIEDLALPAPTIGPATQVPPPLPFAASRDAILAQNEVLRKLLSEAQYQMERDHALKALMNDENGRMRERLFTKATKKPKQTTNAHARHLTGEEALQELAKSDWLRVMKEVWKDPIFKQRRNAIEQHERQEVQSQREEEKARARKQKEIERAAKKFAKQVAAAEKRVVAAEKRAAAAAKRAATTAARSRGVRGGAGAKRGMRGGVRGRPLARHEDSDDYDSDDNLGESSSASDDDDSHKDADSDMPHLQPTDATVSIEQQDDEQGGMGLGQTQGMELRRSRRIGAQRDQPIWRELREKDLI